MMLFKLSIKNITKSIKDYAIYFFTLVLGVAIFYVFNAIDSQTVMLNVSSSTSEIIRLMTLFLPVVKAGQNAVVFLRDCRRSKYFVIQFLLGICKV